MYSYKTKNVCSKEITFEINDGKINNVNFSFGCEGNLKGISILVEDMPASEVVKKLKNITCGSKNTSCPAQLADAIEKVLRNEL